MTGVMDAHAIAVFSLFVCLLVCLFIAEVVLEGGLSHWSPPRLLPGMLGLWAKTIQVCEHCRGGSPSPLCVPVHSSPDAQTCGSLWHSGAEKPLLRYRCSTPCRLKQRDKRKFSPRTLTPTMLMLPSKLSGIKVLHCRKRESPLWMWGVGGRAPGEAFKTWHLSFDITLIVFRATLLCRMTRCGRLVYGNEQHF